MARIKLVTEGLDEPLGGDGAVEDSSQLPENDMAEMATAQEEIDDLADGVNESIDSAQVLTDAADDVQASVDSGEGLTEPAAQALERLANKICAGVGVWKAPLKIAREGHKLPITRVQATKEALDGLRERIKKIWESVKKYFWKAVEAVKNFFKGLFNSATKLKNRAESIKKKAVELKDKKYGAEAKVDADSFGQPLRKNNKLAEVATISLWASGFSMGDKGALKKASVESIAEFSTAVKDAIGSVDVEADFDSKLNKAFSLFSTKLAMASAKQTKSADHPAPAGCNVYEQELAMGDMSIYAINPMAFTKAALKPVLNSLKITIGKKDGFKDDVKFGEVAPLPQATIESLAENIAKGCAGIEGETKVVAEIEKMGKDLEAACNEAAKKGGEDKDKQKVVAENSPLASTAAKVAQNLLGQLAAGLKSWEIKTAKGALDYCSASLAKLED